MIFRKFITIFLFCVLLFSADVFAEGTENKNDENIEAFWAELVGTIGDQNKIDNVSGFDFSSGGFVIGYDKEFGSEVRFGVSAGYIKTDVNSDIAGIGSDIDTYSIGMYGSYDGVHKGKYPFYIDAALVFGFGDIETTFPGLKGKTDANSITISGEYGCYLQYTKQFFLIPVIGFQTSFVSVDGYNETGKNAREIAGDDSNFFSSKIGLRSNYDLENGIECTGNILWVHEFSNARQVKTKSRAVGSSTDFVTTDGIDMGADRAVLGAGVIAKHSESTSTSLHYEAELGEEYISHTGDLIFRYEF